MRALLPLLLLIAAPCALARQTERSLQPPAPEFPAQAVWLNARDLSMARLRGKRVVLVAFLNSMNINSLRAMSALKAWDQRYGLDGLMIIGVHTPEYSFQKNPAAMKEAFRSIGVQFPIVLDNERLVWKAYANDGWPAFYLIDRKGRVVFDRLGEGGYEELEEEIRAQLQDLTGVVDASPPTVVDPPAVGGECGEITPEVGVGSQRGAKIIDMDAGEVPESMLLVTERQGELSTRGRWMLEPEYLRLNQQNADLAAFTRVVYRGAQGFGVLGRGEGGPTKFWVRQDDLWLDSTSAGKDIRFDEERRSYVSVDTPRFYDLVRNPNDNLHELIIIPLRIGGRIYGFSFNNKCLRVD